MWKCSDCLASLSNKIKEEPSFDVAVFGEGGRCLKYLTESDWNNEQLALKGGVGEEDLSMSYGIEKIPPSGERKIGTYHVLDRINSNLFLFCRHTIPSSSSLFYIQTPYSLHFHC